MLLLVFILGAAFGICLTNLLTIIDRIRKYGLLEMLIIDALVEGALLVFILSFLNMLVKLK